MNEKQALDIDWSNIPTIPDHIHSWDVSSQGIISKKEMMLDEKVVLCQKTKHSEPGWKIEHVPNPPGVIWEDCVKGPVLNQMPDMWEIKESKCGKHWDGISDVEDSILELSGLATSSLEKLNEMKSSLLKSQARLRLELDESQKTLALLDKIIIQENKKIKSEPVVTEGQLSLHEALQKHTGDLTTQSSPLITPNIREGHGEGCKCNYCDPVDPIIANIVPDVIDRNAEDSFNASYNHSTLWCELKNDDWSLGSDVVVDSSDIIAPLTKEQWEEFWSDYWIPNREEVKNERKTST